MADSPTIAPEHRALLTERHSERLNIPFVTPRPLRAALFLCRTNPAVFALRDGVVAYPHCDLCGGILNEQLFHCPRCHLDFADAGHQCTQNLAISKLLAQAKTDLQVIEMAMPLSVLTKKMRVVLSPTRRSIWIRKVRRSRSPRELLVCLFLLEQRMTKASLPRWYKVVVPSPFAQLAVPSLASLVVRIHALDGAIKYVKTGEGEEEKEKGAK